MDNITRIAKIWDNWLIGREEYNVTRETFGAHVRKLDYCESLSEPEIDELWGELLNAIDVDGFVCVNCSRYCNNVEAAVEVGSCGNICEMCEGEDGEDRWWDDED